MRQLEKSTPAVLVALVTNYSYAYQVGDVELTKAWIGDLATLGHKIPPFNQLPSLEEENSCAEKVSC